MIDDPGFCAAAAHLDDQLTIMGDWSTTQYITLELSDAYGELAPVEATLTSREARDLAFRLLMVAELADRRAEGLS